MEFHPRILSVFPLILCLIPLCCRFSNLNCRICHRVCSLFWDSPTQFKGFYISFSDKLRGCLFYNDFHINQRICHLKWNFFSFFSHVFCRFSVYEMPPYMSEYEFISCRFLRCINFCTVNTCFVWITTLFVVPATYFVGFVVFFLLTRGYSILWATEFIVFDDF